MSPSWAQSPDSPAGQPEPAAVVSPVGSPVDAGDPTLEPEVDSAPFVEGGRPGAASVVTSGTSAPISVSGIGILVVLTDLDARVPSEGARIKVSGGQASALLVDGGEAPDMTAEDGVYTGLLVASGTGTTEIVVETMDGELIWAGQVELLADLESPSLRIDFAVGGGATADYRSDGAGIQTPAFEGSGPVPVPGDGLTPQVVTTMPVQSVGSSPASGTTSWLPVWLALGLVLGAFGGAWARLWSTRSPALDRVGGGAEVRWPLGMADQDQPVRIVGLGAGVDDTSVLLAALRWFEGQATVLVVPRAESRGSLAAIVAGKSSVFWLSEDRPAVAQLEKALEALAVVGPVVVLVQGPEALEPPDSDEAPDAVVRELGELLTPVIVLVPEDFVGDDESVCRLKSGLGGYTAQGRLVITGLGAEESRWVEVST